MGRLPKNGGELTGMKYTCTGWVLNVGLSVSASVSPGKLPEMRPDLSQLEYNYYFLLIVFS